MQNVIKIRFCQNLSKFQDRTKESRRENGESGEDSQPLRFDTNLNHWFFCGSYGSVADGSVMYFKAGMNLGADICFFDNL